MSLRRRRFLAARTLKRKNRELDALTDEVSEGLVERGTSDPENVPGYLDLIFVAAPWSESETMLRNR